MAQDGTPRPDSLWTFDAVGGADVNDVAIDADGKVTTAVQSDGTTVESGDDEVFAWDLARSKTSSTPTMRDDPSPGFGDPEGMQVVAIEQNPGAKGDFIAVGNEGSSDTGKNNVYVYRRSSGGGSESNVSYAGDRNAPEGAVQEMWFLDRDTLLVEHEDALSVFTHVRGTQYEEVKAGRWTASDEKIVDVDASPSADRIAVLTVNVAETADNTLTLRLLEPKSGGALESVAVSWTTSQTGETGHVALSKDGEFVAVGTSGKTLYYTAVEENTEGDDSDPKFRFSEFPWSSNGPDALSEVAIAPDGRTLAAGFANAQLFVYQQTNVTQDGPRAERAFDRPIDTGQPPQGIQFADGNRSLFAQAAGLMAFNHRQFQGSDEIRPLWTLPNVNAFATSADGERITVAGTEDGEGVVEAYEQSYQAELSVQAPANVQPGRTFNVTATIENQGSVFDAYRLAISDLDGSWNVQAPEEPLELLPGETGNATLSVTPSRSQSPGEVSFTVRAISQASPDQRSVGQAEATVRVQEVHAADIDVDTNQRSIGQGDSLQLEPNVSNAGNTREPIVLRVGQDASWTVSIDGDEASRATFRLDPGESVTPTVEIQAPEDAAKGTRNTFTFVAEPKEGGSEARAEVPVVVEPSYGAVFEVPTETVDVEPGQTVNTDVPVVNDGNTRDTFTLDVTSNASNPEHLWRADLSTDKVTLDGGDERTVTVSVDVPRGASPGDSATVTLTATSSATGDEVGEASYDLAVPEQTQDSPTSALVALAAIGLAAVAVRRRTE